MSSKKELIDKQAQFWVVIAGGATLTAACEASWPLVPVTWTRWHG
jgi:hypothetical protein